MKKSIKVSEDVSHALIDLQRPRETFSDVVERLLDIHEGVQQLIKVMEVVPAYQLWKARQAANKIYRRDTKKKDITWY